MSPRAQARLLDRLEREHGPRVRKAFEAAIRELRRGVNLADLQRMIAAGDIAGALAVIGVATPVFRDLEQEIARAFEGAGRAFTRFLPKNVRDPQGLQVRFRYDMNHPQAVAWVQRNVGEFITNVAEDARAGVTWQLRREIERGLTSDRQIQAAARRIVGHVNPRTGRREGGILGLTRPQTEYLENMRQIVSDPERIREYFIRNRETGEWEPRYKLAPGGFKDEVLAAITDGRALAPDRVSKLTTQFSNNMLRERGRTIARTETLNALRAGQHQAFVQGAEQAGLSEEDVTRTWDASRDRDTRPTHAAADGQTVTGRDTPFTVGGYRMRYPGDSSLGAPASEIINCRCIQRVQVDWIGQVARRQNAA